MRSVLLDTQVALWLLTGSPRLPEGLFKEKIGVEPTRLIFHQVSTWEIQIKYELGKLPLPKKPSELLPAAIIQSGFEYELIEDKGIFMLDRLPPIHRDPFDRLLIAHALVNGWTIFTNDQAIERYPVQILAL